MNNTDKFDFSADRPINSIEEDLLGRAEFSKSLAEAITSWGGEDSLVVALYGNWGDGKSSIKNMVLSFLREKTNKPTIIEFSPWEWAAQEKITQAFFDEISKSIGKENDSEKYKKLAKKFEKYGGYLSASEILLSSASSSLPILIPILASISFISSLFTNYQSITIAITAILALYISVVKWGAEILKKIGVHYDGKANDSKKALSEIRAELKEELRSLELPILIVMDDLDRLSTSELRMIFQLIKANTDFSNVIFLLLFQKNIVESKLTDATQSGQEYLEKIIQVPFNIPKAEVSKVHRVLFKKIKIILNSDGSANSKFDNKRWEEIFYGGLNKYFKNLRDVYRFTSTLKFHFNLLKGRCVFEVNPVDLIAIESIRVFEPKLYHEIYINKGVFTGYLVSSSYDNGSEKKRRENIIKNIFNKCDVDNDGVIERILKNLFPNIKSIIGNYYYDYEYQDNWFADGRICHEKNFDQYFQLSLESVEITKSDLEQFLVLTAHKELLINAILDLEKRGLLTEFLLQFEIFSKRISIDSAKPYIGALLEASDLVDENSSESFTPFSAPVYLYNLFYLFLKNLNDKDKRGNIVIENSNGDHGLIIIAQLLLSEEKSRERTGEILLNNNDYNDIKENFIKKLKHLAYYNSDLFISKNTFLFFLYRWKSWGDENEVVEWLANKTNDTEGLVKILKGMVNTSTSCSSGIIELNYHIRGEYISDFLGVEKLEKAINSINLSELNEDDLKVIELAKIGIERKKNNQDDFFS
ncbi:KAP family NTPase [Acinetobacter bereziniae]|uniref:KAP family P-loop NTPase fold protein n=1 Tax=Acinetobacter bereziniae TaxID=106648 RepID=UPI0021CD902B|nr:KAP family NTPase [Acinetobacter bereziniae]MCU4541199.1 KAP family NTPase [Acinetobacter bereziniae]MCU4628074.1 KAP family NTPase [Acinetobacter bereziniae]